MKNRLKESTKRAIEFIKELPQGAHYAMNR